MTQGILQWRIWRFRVLCFFRDRVDNFGQSKTGVQLGHCQRRRAVGTRRCILQMRGHARITKRVPARSHKRIDKQRNANGALQIILIHQHSCKCNAINGTALCNYFTDAISAKSHQFLKRTALWMNLNKERQSSCITHIHSIQFYGYKNGNLYTKQQPICVDCCVLNQRVDCRRPVTCTSLCKWSKRRKEKYPISDTDNILTI